MEIKVNVDDARFIDEGIRTKLLEGAVTHIMQELKPELVRSFVEKTLAEALRNFNAWDIQKVIQEKAKKALSDALTANEEEINTRIQKEVKKGVDDALNGLNENIRELVAQDVALILKQRLDGRYPPR